MRNPFGPFYFGLMMDNGAGTSNSVFLRQTALNNGATFGNPSFAELEKFMGWDYAKKGSPVAFEQAQEKRDYRELAELYKKPYMDTIQQIKDAGMYTMQTLGTGEVVFWYPFVVASLADKMFETATEEAQEEQGKPKEEEDQITPPGQPTGKTRKPSSAGAGPDKRLSPRGVGAAPDGKPAKTDLSEGLSAKDEIDQNLEMSLTSMDTGNVKILTQTLELEDTELIDFHLNVSDDNLVTHYYVMGDFRYNGGASPNTTDLQCWRWSTVRSHPLFEYMYRNGVDWDPDAFLFRYGSRPKVDIKNQIKSPGFAQIWADQMFLKHWLNCYTIDLQVAFLPDAYPGQKIHIKSLGVECYVFSVSHTFGNSWSTTVKCSMPLVLKDKSKIPPLPFWSIPSTEEVVESEEEAIKEEFGLNPNSAPAELYPTRLSPFEDTGDLWADIEAKRKKDAEYVQGFLKDWSTIRDMGIHDMIEDFVEENPVPIQGDGEINNPEVISSADDPEVQDEIEKQKKTKEYQDYIDRIMKNLPSENR